MVRFLPQYQEIKTVDEYVAYHSSPIVREFVQSKLDAFKSWYVFPSGLSRSEYRVTRSVDRQMITQNKHLEGKVREKMQKTYCIPTGDEKEEEKKDEKKPSTIKRKRSDINEQTAEAPNVSEILETKETVCSSVTKKKIDQIRLEDLLSDSENEEKNAPIVRSHSKGPKKVKKSQKKRTPIHFLPSEIVLPQILHAKVAEYERDAVLSSVERIGSKRNTSKPKLKLALHVAPSAEIKLSDALFEEYKHKRSLDQYLKNNHYEFHTSASQAIRSGRKGKTNQGYSKWKFINLENLTLEKARTINFVNRTVWEPFYV